MTQRNDNMENTHEELCAILNAQTGKLPWHELQRHFARGVVIYVDRSLDLVEVAAAMAEDNRHSVDHWMHSQLVRHAIDEDAVRWHQQQTEFWCVVSAPWVLVQEIVDSE